MRSRKRFKWAVLVVVPLVIGLALGPVARYRQERMRAEEATRKLQIGLMSSIDIPYTRGLRAEEAWRLIDQGADVNARLSDGKTVLMLAIEARKPEIVRLLLDRGVSLNVNMQIEVEGTAAISHITALTVAKHSLQFVRGIGLNDPNNRESVRWLAQEIYNAARIVQILKAAGAHE